MRGALGKTLKALEPYIQPLVVKSRLKGARRAADDGERSAALLVGEAGLARLGAVAAVARLRRSSPAAGMRQCAAREDRRCRCCASAISPSAAPARRRSPSRSPGRPSACGCKPGFLSRGHGGGFAAAASGRSRRMTARAMSATSRCCWPSTRRSPSRRPRAGARLLLGAGLRLPDHGRRLPERAHPHRLRADRRRCAATASAMATSFPAGRCAPARRPAALRRRGC